MRIIAFLIILYISCFSQTRNSIKTDKEMFANSILENCPDKEFLNRNNLVGVDQAIGSTDFFCSISPNPFVTSPGEKFVFEILVKDSAIKKIEANIDFFGKLKHNNGTICQIEKVDFNKEKAINKYYVFKSDSFYFDRLENDFQVGVYTVHNSRIHFNDNTSVDFGNLLYPQIRPMLRVINKEKLPVIMIDEVSNDIQQTVHIVNIVLPDISVNSNGENISFGDFARYPDYPGLSWIYKFYETHPDSVDILFNYDLLSHQHYGYGGYWKNDIEGIGDPIFTYDSYKTIKVKKLRGSIELRQNAEFPFKGTNCFSTNNHEFFHSWGVGQDFSRLWMNYGSHWPITTSFRSTIFGDGARKIEKAADNYNVRRIVDSVLKPDVANDLELYILGLIPAENVFDTISVLVNPSLPVYAEDSLGWYYYYSADSLMKVDINKVMNVLGSRKPDYNNSQKEFRIATVIPYYRKLTEKELSYYDFLISEWEKDSSIYGVTLPEALRYKAKVSMKIPLPINSSENRPPSFTIFPPDTIILFKDSLLILDISANDPENDTIIFSILMNNGASIDSLTGLFLFKTNNIGDYKFIIEITDGINYVTKDFIVKVIGVTGFDDKYCPTIFSLKQNYPNPFNHSTIINYSIAKQCKVTLKIFDILGKELITIVDEEKALGDYSIEFNAAKFSSGVYFYRIQAGDFISTMKLLVMN